ncbi:hypothetical protein FHS29_004060 [Saccharothrix tamanrassetensis]|uniref:FHA domain-containing protein n=1 Tax=Saccharothrix tamanrassetensis TaxID=1051531 RepID=A0A841CNA9_9PSEU|nr:FHA domain-containing protein [Saccharothrix tamanrassetensis]MBB5957465.1 hypothetical protein [Saccharothrix tamanrassetensis]
MTVYTPGAAVAVVADRTWLLIGAAPASDVVRRCWELVRGGAGLDDVLSVIAHEGFRSVGSFALVRCDDAERRVVLRGDAVVGVVGADGVPLELRDDGAATWVDTGLPDEVAELRLAAGVGAGPELPVECGVVLASLLVATLAEVTPQPVTSVEPEDGVAIESAPTVVAALPKVPDVDPAVAERWTEVIAVPHGFTPSVQGVVVPQAEQGVAQSVSQPVPQVVAQPVPAVAPQPAPKPAPKPAPQPAAQPAATPRVDETSLRRNASPDDTRHIATTGTPRVRAIACPARHLNPEHAIACRVCGQALPPQDAFVVPRPPLGVLRLSTGEVISLDRSVILGRDPQVADRGSTGPHAIRLANQGNDISRNHVEVRLDGWDVLVVDLGSKNGTTVIAPGWSPQELAGLIPAILTPGSRVMVGEGAFFTYEVTG